jgi:hypothetical protein
MRRQMYCFAEALCYYVDGGKTMHHKISALRRAASSLAIGVALLLGMGMTAHAQPGKKVIKSEQKLEKRALKIHQKDERVSLKEHQREQRETYKQSWRSQHKPGKMWKHNKWPKPHPNFDHNARKQCIKGCKEAHKNAVRACRGRTGSDRRACERAANQAHRSCQASCPR